MPYTRIKAYGGLLYDADGKQFMGKVQYGEAVYPDFLQFNTGSFWSEMLQTTYSQSKFAGIWLNMN